jgi:uncharacterized alkaline shock family protein YloU
LVFAASVLTTDADKEAPWDSSGVALNVNDDDSVALDLDVVVEFAENWHCAAMLLLDCVILVAAVDS